MSLTRFADLEEDNDRLRDQLGEAEGKNTELEAVIKEQDAAILQLKDEINELKAAVIEEQDAAILQLKHEIRELKAQLEAKEEFTTTHGTVA